MDTHADTHTAAICDHLGKVVATATFDTTPTGHRQLSAWARRNGRVTTGGVRSALNPSEVVENKRRLAEMHLRIERRGERLVTSRVMSVADEPHIEMVERTVPRPARSSV